MSTTVEQFISIPADTIVDVRRGAVAELGHAAATLGLRATAYFESGDDLSLGAHYRPYGEAFDAVQHWQAFIEQLGSLEAEPEPVNRISRQWAYEVQAAAQYMVEWVRDELRDENRPTAQLRALVERIAKLEAVVVAATPNHEGGDA